MVAAPTAVHDHDASVGKGRHRGRAAEFARTITRTAQLADQLAIGTNDVDQLGLVVKDLEVARAVKGHAFDVAELLPVRARQHRTQSVELLEAGLQPAVLAGKVHNLLGGGGSSDQQPGKRGPASHFPDRKRLQFLASDSSPGDRSSFHDLSPSDSRALWHLICKLRMTLWKL